MMDRYMRSRRMPGSKISTSDIRTSAVTATDEAARIPGDRCTRQTKNDTDMRADAFSEVFDGCAAVVSSLLPENGTFH